MLKAGLEICLPVMTRLDPVQGLSNWENDALIIPYRLHVREMYSIVSRIPPN